MFGFYFLIRTVPVNSEWRIGDTIVKGIPWETIFSESVPKFHVARAPSTNHRIRFCDGIGRWIDLLTKSRYLSISVKFLKTFSHCTQHLRSPHCLVIDGFDNSII